MPIVAERLRHITLKVERAKRHISDLKAELQEFLDTKPYQVACKIEPDTRRPVYYVSAITPTPDALPLIAGDAIQNLMGALDHLAYQLVSSDTADNPPNRNWIYFPIQDDHEKYEGKKLGKIQGASAATIAAIDAHKPYREGNQPLWELYRLNNIEKHRLLLTVGIRAGVNLTQTLARDLDLQNPLMAAMAAMLERMPPFVIHEAGLPLIKIGHEIFKDAPDAKPNPKQQFTFTVALDEAGIIQAAPLVETLDTFVALVETIVANLTPLLKETA